MEREIKEVVTARRQLEGGGFEVRRTIGGGLPHVDPFLLFDHAGEMVYGPGEAKGAPSHPHRGFETVTYMTQGSFVYWDSIGNTGITKAGDVEWMTAGSGVVHGAGATPEMLQKGGTIEAFQLWVNLPRTLKFATPRSQNVEGKTIPQLPIYESNITTTAVNTIVAKTATPAATVRREIGRVRVIAGTCNGVSSVIETRTPIVYFDVQLDQSGASFDVPIPVTHNCILYVYRGAAQFGNRTTPTIAKEGQMVVLNEPPKVTTATTATTATSTVRITANATIGARILVIAGRPLREPVVPYGPFVMNTQAEIQQCFVDYRAGRIGSCEVSERKYAASLRALGLSQAADDELQLPT